MSNNLICPALPIRNPRFKNSKKGQGSPPKEKVLPVLSHKKEGIEEQIKV